MGRRKIAERITEQTERPCSDSVVGIALGHLGLGAKRKPPLEITDQSEIPEELSIEELIAARIKASVRKKSKTQRHRKTLELPAEPVGIIVFGDPHLDDDGCDIGSLYNTVTLAQSTEGVLAACVGDGLNNWVGRLATLFADSSICVSDAYKLFEWFLSSMQFLAICGGNHDAWASGPGVDPLEWLTARCDVMCYAPDEIRITLAWRDEPDLEPVVWILRHDFSGRSWYHPTHGPNKEAMLDGKCHILTAGHIHQWGELTTEQRHGRITSAIRVRGYKRCDAFAIAKNFSEQEYGECCMIIIDPFAQGPGRITTFWDIQTGCNYLTMLRTRK